MPKYEGLSIDDFLLFAKKHASTLQYLPDEKDWLKIDKQWLCDVLYTLKTKEVQEMIDLAVL